jgi:hypothetical protein
MQKCFDKSKQFEKKKQGTRERIEILTIEVRQLEKSIESGNFPTQKLGQVRHQLKDAKAEGRTKTFDGFVASKGKSAADNLALLRSAKAWDLWVHLRDMINHYLTLNFESPPCTSATNTYPFSLNLLAVMSLGFTPSKSTLNKFI